jgi:hypothetical protein
MVIQLWLRCRQHNSTVSRRVRCGSGGLFDSGTGSAAVAFCIFVLLSTMKTLTDGFTRRRLKVKPAARRKERPMVATVRRLGTNLLSTAYHVGCGVSGGFLTQTARGER